MNNKILISFLISMLAGLSTLIGCLFIFIKPKNINKFIGISLSFSATIMILISLLELIPDGFFYLSNKYGYIYSLIILIFILFIGYIINVLINKKLNKNNSSDLYKVGILSMIALMIHNLPEGILTFLTSTIDIKLGLKLSLAIMMHNIPEGIAIAVPIYYSTNSKYKAIKNTLISGLSEPAGALIAYFFLYKFREVVLQEENPTLLNISCLDAGLYTWANVMPNCRYFQSNAVHGFDEVREEQLRYIQEKKVEFILARNYYPEEISQNYELIMKENYAEQSSIYYLFKRK